MDHFSTAARSSSCGFSSRITTTANLGPSSSYIVAAAAAGSGAVYIAKDAHLNIVSHAREKGRGEDFR